MSAPYFSALVVGGADGLDFKADQIAEIDLVDRSTADETLDAPQGSEPGGLCVKQLGLTSRSSVTVITDMVVRGSQFMEQTFTFRAEMRDDDHGETGIGRKSAEKVL